MIRYVFGVLKIGFGVITVLADLFSTIPNVMPYIKSELYAQLLGFLLASMLLLSYAAYLFYSGWTQLKGIEVKKTVFLWLGIAATVAAVYLCYISHEIVLQIFSVILILIGAQETFRLIKAPKVSEDVMDDVIDNFE